MGKTHWKKLNNPDFLGAYALEPGEDLIVTIDYAREEQFTGTGGKKDEGIVIHFMDRGIKPMICNATNAKTITKVVGSPYIEDWHGHKIQLYAAEVSAFGDTVEALRVRDYAPMQETYTCEDCGCEIMDSGGYKARAIVQTSRKRFGRDLCMDCAKKAKEAKENTEVSDESNED